MSPQPTSKQRERMVEGFKFVGIDLTTRGYNRPDFRYHLGAWHTAEDPDPTNTSGCPHRPGDGLCVAHTVEAASSGGQLLSRSIMLLVGYLPEDVLGHELNKSKVRVRRLWVEPDPIDPIQLALWTIQTGGSADLRRADLYCADLRRADLRSADLRSADLHGADLRSADLRRADLRSADLHGADLRRADLHGANLYCADMRSADLRSANLRSADLRSANLRRADLRSADLHGADMRRADLHGAKVDSYISLPAGWVVCNGMVVQA